MVFFVTKKIKYIKYESIYNTIGLFEYLIKVGNIHTSTFFLLIHTKMGTLKKYSNGILSYPFTRCLLQ